MSIPFTEGAEGFAGLYVMDDPDILYVSRIDFKTIVPFNPDYLPKGGVGYTESYDIQYDGNTEGKVTVEIDDKFYFVKVSDRILTKEELVGASYVFSDETFVITEQDIIDNSVMGVTTKFYGVIGGVFGDELPMLVSSEACTVSFDGKPVVVPSDGTYFLDALALGLHAHVYSLSNETIHKIDQKYLPGVCLPMVELSTTFAGGARYTAEENAKLNAAWETGTPAIIKCPASIGAFNFNATSFVWGRLENSIARSYTALFGSSMLQIYSTVDGETWSCNIEQIG